MAPSSGFSDGHSSDLALAHVLADDADATTMSRFKSLDLRIETKPDMTPVTDADKAVEQAMRATLGRVRRRDAILGEEMGRSGAGSRCWVIDPIDGTKNYVRGVPVWATLVALMDGEDVVAGVVSAPALGRRWWAAKGAGAFTGRSLSSATPCRVSKVATLTDASLSYSSLSGWEEQGRIAEFVGLMRAVWRTRAYGDFWSYTMVAEGAVDIACEPAVSLWDLAPLSLIVTEAGGRFTAVDGTGGAAGGSAVATNGTLHDEVLGRLNQGPRPVPAA